MATRRMSSDEFIKQWWKKRFPDVAEPRWDSTIKCIEAVDLLDQYYKYLESLP